ncbi:heavy-metal-associated domain-containing protein [uncultured Planktosalinus sp.]|uniref:heavy-metal-associated domain-containing protein n=1 Tax=uncultured Planktosalinus sp. TaxID=1810935 RepID=UPI0030DC003A
MNTTLNIQNLKCGGCSHTVITKLSVIENIENVNVDVENDAVSFDFVSKTDLETVKQKLLTLGYPAVGEYNPFSAKAKSFVSCAVGRMAK